VSPHQDFIGLNHYFHNRVHYGFNKNKNEQVSDMGWELYPEALYHTLVALKKHKIPVYVQGMVWDVTAIHTTYPDFFSSRIKKLVFHKDTNPFLSDMFKKVAGRKEMMDVIEHKGPCVIMATSGMMAGGPAVEYFKNLADNPKNTLVFTCYQGVGSLGRRIQSGEKEIAFALLYSTRFVVFPDVNRIPETIKLFTRLDWFCQLK